MRTRAGHGHDGHEHDDDAIGLLMRAAMLFREEMFRMVEEEGLTPPMAFALRRLAEPLSQRDLARCLGYDPSNITALADRLEERGLIERNVDPSDRRVKVVSLSEAGRAFLDRLDSRLRSSHPVRRLTAAEQGQLALLLRKLVGADEVASRTMLGG